MMNRGFSYILSFILVLLLPVVVASSQGRVVVSLNVGECDLTVESDERWHTLRLRAHHPKYKGCDIDKDSMVLVLSAAFSKKDSPKLDGSYSSLSFGRLIDYPWLSQYLATTAYGDHRWDSKKGKPVAMDINKYVSQVLFKRELMGPIEAVFERGGYRAVGATVEKVLVGGFREVPFYQGKLHLGRVPYDAQVWFRLERN